MLNVQEGQKLQKPAKTLSILEMILNNRDIDIEIVELMGISEKSGCHILNKEFCVSERYLRVRCGAKSNQLNIFEDVLKQFKR